MPTTTPPPPTLPPVPATVLVVLAYDRYPMKPTIWDHLHAFDTVPGVRTVYLNLAWQAPTPQLLSLPFDLVVYHYTFFASRFGGQFAQLAARAEALKSLPCPVAALPQDEYYRCDELSAVLNNLGVDVVFSCLPPTTWPVVYRRLNREKTKIHQVITGYLCPKRLQNIARLAQRGAARDIDIGYRTWRVPAWLGRHGVLKGDLADIFTQAAPAYGLKTDISLEEKDYYYGDDWYRFLLRCKYSIGMEGGVSLVDPDGGLRHRVDDYTAAHPQATFEQIEAACFPGQDGQVRAYALSPRHLECCATRTAQVLVEGDYFGILKPWEHYLPLKRDMSNLHEILQLMKEDKLREEMVARAWREVVESGLWTYEQFARFVIEKSLPGPRLSQNRLTPGQQSLVKKLRQQYDRLWVKAAVNFFVQGSLKPWLFAHTPAPLRGLYRRLKKVLRAG